LSEEPRITVIPTNPFSVWEFYREHLVDDDDPLATPFRGVRGVCYDQLTNSIVLGDDVEPEPEVLARAINHEYIHYIFYVKWKEPELSSKFDELRARHPQLAILV